MEVVAHEFASYNRKGETLHRLVERKTTNPIEAVLLGLILGPIKYDAERVHEAVHGGGTTEPLLNEILLDLSPADIHVLSYAFQQKYNVSLSKRVQDDLSGGARKLFAKLLDPNRVLRPSFPPVPPPNASAPASDTSTTPAVKADDPQQLLDADVATLHRSGAARVGTNEDAFYEILTGRTHEHLVQICRHYRAKHNKSLSHVVESEFSGHPRTALLHILASAEVVNPKVKADAVRNADPQAVRDAVLLEETMKGLGTDDRGLGMRILRAHWSRRRMDAVSAAYLDVYDKKLSRRVAGETSGAWEELLIALMKGTGAGY
ncbi:hypothetical protein B0H12DRAFT_475992 [Mycena haematopus]|nr:hypothetical protein B0H12DRAFT_475992 [Mycena haematopus]